MQPVVASEHIGKCDLVLQGGGVKGIALAGAWNALRETAFPSVQRVAGTSAGAIVAALIAAGITPVDLERVMHDLDYSRFQQTSWIGRLGAMGKGVDLVRRGGLYQTDYLREWLSRQLAVLGVRTWADLRYVDPDSDNRMPPYRLVVMVTDLSRGRMLRLPWDYRELCDLDPDTQSVADAVVASASIPFFFQPQHLTCGPAQNGEVLTLTDGGSLSNFAINVFDRVDEAPYRWPTLGVRLSTRRTPAQEWHPVGRPVQMLVRLFSAMGNAHDTGLTDQRSVQDRTIFVDTAGIDSVDFHITPAERDALYRNGAAAAREFLKTWDWATWRRLYGR